MGLFSFIGGKKQSLLSSGILSGTVDSHSHVLFGVDDGVRTLEESLSILQYEESLGVKEIWCTPHIIEDGINDHDLFKARFEQLCQAYSGPIRLHLAAEYMLDTVFEHRLKDRDLLTIDDETLLVETSTIAPPIGLYDIFRDILSAGYRPLFAHPERYVYLDEANYERLRRLGVQFQLNLPSLVGFYGETVKRKAEWLLKNDFYTHVGSDCHRRRLVNEQFERAVLSKDVIERLGKLIN